MTIQKMIDLELEGKTLLIREDLNVPIQAGLVTDDLRIRAALPTIKLALEQGAAVILLSHLGRPTEGEYNSKYSLSVVAKCLSSLLSQHVPLMKDWLDGVEVAPGQVVLCENVRFNPGEAANDDALARKIASLGDVFVMDAFAAAHRAHASTHGVARFAKVACAGPLLAAELAALSVSLKNPARPLIAIVGGSKVSTKIEVLESLIKIADQIIVGGGIANTFMAAAGLPVGKSLYEPDFVETAKELITLAREQGAAIPIPKDVVVAKELSETARAELKSVHDVADDDKILDVGPDTSAEFSALLQNAGTIVWNGPVGVFELPAFELGTKSMALAIAESDAFSIAGGGDTLAAISKYKLADKISYISTGGGAFLKFLEGKPLPSVTVLEKK